MVKRHMGDIEKLALDHLIEEYLEAEKTELEAKAEKEHVKKMMLAINAEVDFPDKDEKSEVYGRLRVIKPEANYSLDFRRFIDIFGIDIFLRCFEITKAEMDVDKWTEMVKNEEVVEGGLRYCILEPRTLQPRIRIAREGESDEEMDE